MNWTNMEFLK